MANTSKLMALSRFSRETYRNNVLQNSIFAHCVANDDRIFAAHLPPS